MKLAIIFHGLSSGINDKGEGVVAFRAINSILNQLRHHDVDYFFHTWGSKNDELTQLLMPKNWQFERPIQTEYMGSKIHSTLSKFTSMQKSFIIFNEYRLANRIDYQAALVIRFDLLLYGNILPKNITKDTVAFPVWGNYTGRKDGYLDYYFIIGKNHFMKFNKSVTFVHEYIARNCIYSDSSELFSNHIIIKDYVNEICENVEFSGREYLDFCLEKHFSGYSNRKGEVNFYLSKQLVLYVLSFLHLEYPFKWLYGILRKYAYPNRI